MLHNHPPEKAIDNCDSAFRTDKIACSETLNALEANDEGITFNLTFKFKM